MLLAAGLLYAAAQGQKEEPVQAAVGGTKEPELLAEKPDHDPVEPLPVAETETVAESGMPENQSSVEEPPRSPSMKPTYESILQQRETELYSLRDRCQGTLGSLANQFFQAENQEDQMKLLDQGQAQLAACDASFEGILAQLEAELTENGYSTEKVAEYRVMYEHIKKTALNHLLEQQ